MPGRPAASTRLMLIRHAHTQSNSGGTKLLSGRSDIPLSGRGRNELRRLAARLSGEAPFTAIYTSPLQRARDTAVALSQAGLGPLRICPGLQEIDCGELDGLPLEEVRRRVPALWAANQREDNPRFRWPGGESYREFRARCLRAVRTIAGVHSGERVMVVTHAGVISQVLGAIAGVTPARWSSYRPANSALSEIEWRRCAGTIVGFNDFAHLREP